MDKLDKERGILFIKGGFFVKGHEKEASVKRCFYDRFCRSGERGGSWCNEVSCIGMKCPRCGTLLSFRADVNGWECGVCKDNERKKTKHNDKSPSA